MTINLTIRYVSEEREDRFIPVASIHSFKYEWLPACRELELKWVPKFETGYPILELNKDSLPQIIAELKQLRTYSVDSGTDLLHPYITRFNTVISALEQGLEEIDEIEYIRI